MKKQSSMMHMFDHYQKKLTFHQAMKSSNALPFGKKENGNMLYLKQDTLTENMQTHMHIVGPTGCGKSKLMEHLFREMVTKLPHASFVVLDPKGDLCRSLTKFCLANNLTNRLVLFDPSDEQNVIGFNPLAVKKKAAFTMYGVVEAIKACWGQATFNETPQLKRWLENGIFTLVHAQTTFVETVDVFDIAENWKRDLFVSKLKIEEEIERSIKQEWINFGKLSLPRRKDDVNSSYARIRSFCLHPTIASILGQRKNSLDIGQVVEEGKILLVNLERYKPLEPDQASLLGTLLVNDLVRTVFSRNEDERKPVYLFLDEAHYFMTRDLIPILEEARAFQLFLVLAHQYLDQLGRRDPDVYAAVMKSSRTKVVFGGLSNSDLEILAPELYTNELSAYKIKDTLTAPIFEPVEEVRLVESWSESESTNWGRSVEHSASRTGGVSVGKSTAMTQGKSFSTTDSETETTMRSHTTGRGESEAETESESSAFSSNSSFSSGISYDLQFLLEGDSASYFSSQAQGNTSSSARSTGRSHGTSTMEADTEGEARSQGHAVSIGQSSAVTQGKNQSVSLSLSTGESEGETEGGSHTTGKSFTLQPFHAYHKSQIITKREFQSIDEQLFEKLQLLKGLRKREFVIKFPEQSPMKLTTPWVEPTPKEKNLTSENVQELKQIIFNQTGWYATPEQIKEERRKQLEAWQEEYNGAIEMEKGKDYAAEEPKSYRFK